MSLLLEKMRRARETQITVDAKKFTIRRPLDIEVSRLFDSGEDTYYGWAERFVVDWDLRELDLIPGGGPEVAEFDRALWSEWIGARSDLWKPLGEAIREAYKAHRAKREDAEKNSPPGSTG